MYYICNSYLSCPCFARLSSSSSFSPSSSLSFFDYLKDYGSVFCPLLVLIYFRISNILIQYSLSIWQRILKGFDWDTSDMSILNFVLSWPVWTIMSRCLYVMTDEILEEILSCGVLHSDNNEYVCWYEWILLPNQN